MRPSVEGSEKECRAELEFADETLPVKANNGMNKRKTHSNYSIAAQNDPKRWESGQMSDVDENENWKKLHDELQEKFDTVNARYESLKKEFKEYRESMELQIQRLSDTAISIKRFFLI